MKISDPISCHANSRHLYIYKGRTLKTENQTKMADSVQRYLESTVPELKDLQKRRIFTADEIKSIIKRRTEFEYSMRRRGIDRHEKRQIVRQYVDYESSLEQLRKLRKRKLDKLYKEEMNEEYEKLAALLNSNRKNRISEYSIVRRIHYIYDRALSSWLAGDEQMWLEYIKYARSNNVGSKLSEIFGRALQQVPRSEQLWSMAAGWEWEQNRSVVAARNMYLRALRLLAEESKLIWFEYFRMELAFVVTLVQRRLLLSKNESELSLADLQSLIELNQNDETEVEQKRKLAELQIFKCLIAKSVFSNAMKSIGWSVPFALEFISIVQEVLEDKNLEHTLYFQESLQDLVSTIKQMVVDHVGDSLLAVALFDVDTVSVDSAEFPMKLKNYTEQLQDAIKDAGNKSGAVCDYLTFLNHINAKFTKSDVVDSRIKTLITTLIESALADHRQQLNEKSIELCLDYFKSDDRLDEFIEKISSQINAISIKHQSLWSKLASLNPAIVIQKLESVDMSSLSENGTMENIGELWLQVMNDGISKSSLENASKFSQQNPRCSSALMIRMRYLQLSDAPRNELRKQYPSLVSAIESMSASNESGKVVLEYLYDYETVGLDNESELSIETVRRITRCMTKSYPHSIESWQKALSFEKKISKDLNEYQRVINSLKFCSDLGEEEKLMSSLSM